MKRFSQLLASPALGAAVVVPAVAFAVTHDLQSEVRIPKARATRIALDAAKGGTVRSTELERERGHVVWSFDIARKGESGITEVLVDAKNGDIVAKSHESPASEANEARSEKAESAGPAR